MKNPIVVDGVMYKILFKHIKLSPIEINLLKKERKALKKTKKNKVVYQAMTFCTILKLNSPDDKPDLKDAIAVGQARCSIKDQFDKASGRKVALTEAIHFLFPKPLSPELWPKIKVNRRLLWEQAFDRGLVK